MVGSLPLPLQFSLLACVSLELKKDFSQDVVHLLVVLSLVQGLDLCDEVLRGLDHFVDLPHDQWLSLY